MRQSENASSLALLGVRGEDVAVVPEVSVAQLVAISNWNPDGALPLNSYRNRVSSPLTGIVIEKVGVAVLAIAHHTPPYDGEAPPQAITGTIVSLPSVTDEGEPDLFEAAANTSMFPGVTPVSEMVSVVAPVWSVGVAPWTKAKPLIWAGPS